MNIYVSSALFKDPMEATYTLLHEMGHAYQFYHEPIKYLSSRFKDWTEYECYQYIYQTLRKPTATSFEVMRNSFFPKGLNNDIFDLLKWGFPKMLKPY